MTNVSVFKLNTGEWVIANVQESLDPQNTYVVLKQPRLIRIIPRSQTEYGIGFMPFDMTNPDGNVKLFRSAVTAMPESIDKGLHDSYLKEISNIEIISSLAGVK